MDIPGVYDAMAGKYDAMYDSEECRREEWAVARTIRSELGPGPPTTLDIGCGTGLLLDLGITHAGLYTGVDPSRNMLAELLRKHPSALDLRSGAWEHVDALMPRGAQYELVTALFGAASYLTPDEIRWLPSRASRLLVLMHYREGYWPSYYAEKPEGIDESREAALEIPGARRWTFNDFMVTLVRGSV